MAAAAEEANDVEKLYEHGERLNEAKDKTLVPSPLPPLHPNLFSRRGSGGPVFGPRVSTVFENPV